MANDQATPAVARVWHTQVTDKGALVPSVPDETRAQAESAAIGWAGIRAITVVEQPDRGAVEALLAEYKEWLFHADHGQTLPQERAEALRSAAQVHAALLRLWGFDA